MWIIGFILTFLSYVVGCLFEDKAWENALSGKHSYVQADWSWFFKMLTVVLLIGTVVDIIWFN